MTSNTPSAPGNNAENGTIPLHLWQRAASLAARFHHGQLRKDGATPYIAHPFRVAMIVRHAFNIDDEIALAAALLHDVIEDTTADYDDVLDECGKQVADAVAALTKDMRLAWKSREASYDETLTNASWQAKLVKLADVYDNVCDAMSSKMRNSALKKVPRAIACVGDEPILAAPVKQLQELYDKATS
jgi:guanosine-3',5'-bis(diphosphate) 3'-pyrophosphohydrolase